MMNDVTTVAELRRNRPLVVGLALALTVVIAVLDRHVHREIPLGLLYLLPMGMISTVAKRWQVIVAALLYTVVAETSDAFAWNPPEGVVRDLLSFAAYLAEGLYIAEALALHRVERTHLQTLTREMEARRDAEEQLSLLVGSSALAILTMDEDGRVVQANRAASSLFIGSDTSFQLTDAKVSRLLPALAHVTARLNAGRELRTMMQCQGFRANGEPFMADVWLSLYNTSKGSRTAAIVVDVSDDLRDREESTLEQMLNSSRLIVGAMSHEIRNIAAAISLVQKNIAAQSPGVAATVDFESLQQLTATLERMSSVELSQVKRSATKLNLQLCLEEFRILAQSALREQEIRFEWIVPDDLPTVWADQQSMMQVFLNLLRNSQAALENIADPVLTVKVITTPENLQIHVIDNGPGVASPAELFHPFDKPGAGGGFGLYLSKALVNSFRGNLRYQQSSAGATFIIDLQVHP